MTAVSGTRISDFARQRDASDEESFDAGVVFLAGADEAQAPEPVPRI